MPAKRANAPGLPNMSLDATPWHKDTTCRGRDKHKHGHNALLGCRMGRAKLFERGDDALVLC